MKLRIKNTFYVGVIFFSIMLLWQAYNWFVPLYLDNAIEKWLVTLIGYSPLTKVWVGAVMGLDNLFALIMIPVVSKMSDKTVSQMGKRMPYIVVGLPVAAVAFAFVPIVKGNIILFIFILLIVLTAMNIYRSPAVAMMPDITPKSHRTKANAAINLMGGLGTAIAYILISSYAPLGLPEYFPIIAVSFIMLGCLFFVLFKVDEVKFATVTRTDLEEHFNGNKELIAKEMGEDEPDSTEFGKIKSRNKREQRKNILLILTSIFFFYMASNAVETFLSTYSRSVLGSDSRGLPAFIGLAAGSFIFLYPSALLAEKIGRRAVMLIGTAVISCAAFFAYFITGYTVWVIFPFLAFGIGMSAILTNVYPMLINLCDKKNYAKYTGYYYIATMLAQAITPALAGIFISALFGHRVRNVMLYAAGFMILSFISLLFVDSQNSSGIKKKIKNKSLKTEKRKKIRRNSVKKQLKKN